MKTKINKFIIVALIFMLGFIVYFNSFKNDFVWDDIHLIKQNIYIKDWSGIKDIFTSHIGAGSNTKYYSYRPLQMFTYMMDYFLWGLDAKGYHITNTLIHITVSILLFFIIFFIIDSTQISFIVSLIYLAHPVHTEAVTYISGRADPLVSAFLLLMIIFQHNYWINTEKYKKIVCYSLLIISFLLSLLSKELAITSPFLLMFYEYCLRDKEKYTEVLNKKIIFYLPLFISIGIWFFIKNKFVFLEGMVKDMPSFNTRLITVPRMIFDYVRISLIPVNLHMEYYLPFPRSLFQQGYFEPFIFIIVLLFLFYYLWKKGKRDYNYRIIFFGLGWFLITLTPSMNILYVLNAPFAEHWLYIPAMGFILSIVYTIFYKFKNNDLIKKYSIFSFVVVIVVFSYLTIKQNRTWKDTRTVSEYTIKHSPYSSKAYSSLGYEYIKTGKFIEAMELLKRAIKLDPNNTAALENLKILEIELGNEKY